MTCRVYHPYRLSLCVSFFLIFFFCILFVLAPSAYAEVTLDGSLGPQKALTGPDYEIKAADGTIINQTNLFHSFGKFNVDTNESATFSGPDTISNIIGRVTGGTQSWIDGLIRSTIPDANLFLLNPSGILFGPNASLDVQGSFHVSTADYLRLGEDGVFYTDPNRNSILTVDPPSAFGFLGDNPAAISVQESNLQVPDGKTLSLVGGDIEIVGSETPGSGNVTAPGGRINIASVSSPGEVIPDFSSANPGLDVDSFTQLGRVYFYNSGVDAGGDGGGTVLIRGGRLVLDSSFLNASAKATSGQVRSTGIDIEVSGDVLMDNASQINSNVWEGVENDSGDVHISASRLELNNFSQINSVGYAYYSEQYPASIGNTGDINLDVQDLLLQEGSYIRTTTAGMGDSGDISVRTSDLEINDGSIIFTMAFGGVGNAGNIDIRADSMSFSNQKYQDWPTGITSQTQWPGIGGTGDIQVHTNALDMGAATAISTATFYEGRCGNVSVAVDGEARIEGTKATDSNGNPIPSGIFANTWWTPDGGDCTITADRLEITNNGSIQVSTVRPSFYQVTSGNAGNLEMNVGDLEITNGGFISCNGIFGSGGDSGTAHITADTIFISGLESSTDPFGSDFTGISTTSGQQGGKGGEVNIVADSLLMTNRGSIAAISKGPDPGGDITIDAGSLEVLNGANINTSAFGSGPGGKIEINAQNMRVSGAHPEPYVEEITGKTNLARSGVASQSLQNGGIGGSIVIRASSLQVLDGGQLTTETYGTGNAGTIDVVADNVLVSGVNADLRDFIASSGGDPRYAASGISASSNASLLGDQATGDCGNININAGRLTMQEGGQISSETNTPGMGGHIEVTADDMGLFSSAFVSAKSYRAGKAGDISITTHDTFRIDNSSITTSAEQAQGGNIAISGRNVQEINNALVSAESSGEGDAGDIYIGAADSFLMRNSAVTTEAREADGGNIKLDVGYMVHLVDSEITASVGGGPATVGGNISIDPEYVVLNNSRIVANAFQGRGGNIDIVSDVFLADPNSVVDASSALGIDGEVDIRAPITNVSGTIAPLPKDFRSVIALLRGPCMARIQKGKYSSFVVRARDGLPPEPGGVLPSPLLLQ